MSNADTSPSIAPGNKLERRAVPSISFFEDSKSSYVINIGRKKIRLDYCWSTEFQIASYWHSLPTAILHKAVTFVCSFAGKNNCIEETTGYIEW